MLNNEEQQQEEFVAQPGENVSDLLITIKVNQYGESQLMVNQNSVPLEILYFHLMFMAQAILQNHQTSVANAFAERNRLLVPSNNIVVPR